MAKITYNPAVQHLHGAVGNMVFKQQSGRDVVASKPDHVNQPNTPAQLQQRENFRQSNMPEGLANGMSAGEFLDLVQFLTSLKPDGKN